MKAPESLETLLDYEIIQEVVRPLMSGKEAQVFVVVAGGEECVAKVYKEANQRTFKHRADYTEGRRTRNSRDQRAMSKRTQHGRKKDEDAWRSTEVEMIYRLRDAGVRVPEPINFVEGVLVMELIKDAAGLAAPRLGDLSYSPRAAREIYQKLIGEVVRMLCAGVIHGDLSDFNVLMSHDGPVLIDFPQSIDPTLNPNSQKILRRDVENLHRFLARFAPDEPVLPYGEEIWSLFKANRLDPDTKLTGRYVAPRGKASTEEVMALIEEASFDARKRRGRSNSNEEDDSETSIETLVEAPTPFRRVVDFSREAAGGPASTKPTGKARDGAAPRRRRRASKDSATRVPPKGPASGSTTDLEPAPSKRRRRRGGKNRPKPAQEIGEGGLPSETTTSAATGSESAAAPQSRRRGRRRSRGKADPKSGQQGPKAATDRPSGRRRRRPRNASGPK